MDKEKMKSIGKEMTLLEPVLITKFGSKLKPYIRIIYFILMGLLVLMTLGTIIHAFTVDMTIFILELILLFVSVIIVRMFCEYVNKE